MEAEEDVVEEVEVEVEDGDVDKAGAPGWSEAAREAALEARRANAKGRPQPTGQRGPAQQQPQQQPRQPGQQQPQPQQQQSSVESSSEKVQRAMAAYVSANFEEQKIADEQERIVSNALGVPRTADNKEWDLHVPGKVGIELKTMIKQKNDKITMSKSALARKMDSIQAQGKGFKAFTVVADKRGGGTKYYVKEGVGSFRLGTMKQIGLHELKSMVKV